MNIEECKKMLYNFKFNKMAITKRQQHLENLKNIILKASKRKEEIENYTKMGMNSINIKKLMVEELKEEKLLLEELKKIKKIEDTINKLEQPSKTILLSKYILGQSIDEIAAELYYSSKRIYQLHTKALEEFCVAYKNRHLCDIKDIE